MGRFDGGPSAAHVFLFRTFQSHGASMADAKATSSEGSVEA
jgi:hypothetical protein